MMGMNDADPKMPCPISGNAQEMPRLFTLLELMSVVVMVGVMATLAIPSIRRQLHDRRNNQAAHEISLLYRTARARAIGRGGAVLVRFSPGTGGSTRGRVEIFEASNALAGQVALLPATTCQLTNWAANTGIRSLASYDPTSLSSYDNVQLALFDSAGAAQSNADVCFSALGRAYLRFAATGNFASMAQVPYIQVSPVDGSGLTRTVLIVPDGSSRLTL